MINLTEFLNNYANPRIALKSIPYISIRHHPVMITPIRSPITPIRKLVLENNKMNIFPDLSAINVKTLHVLSNPIKTINGNNLPSSLKRLYITEDINVINLDKNIKITRDAFTFEQKWIIDNFDSIIDPCANMDYRENPMRFFNELTKKVYKNYYDDLEKLKSVQVNYILNKKEEDFIINIRREINNLTYNQKNIVQKLLEMNEQYIKKSEPLPDFNNTMWYIFRFLYGNKI